MNTRTDTEQDGCALITAERRRQVEQEGWSAEHDNGHVRGEMALAAACYAKAAVLGHHIGLTWPWSNEWYKPGPYTKIEARIRALVKAGALIAAEIDRMERLRIGRGTQHPTAVLLTAPSCSDAPEKEPEGGNPPVIGRADGCPIASDVDDRSVSGPLPNGPREGPSERSERLGNGEICA